MLKLYSAEVCPFAQRTRALLTHLGVAFELREIDLSDRDPAFLELTPTGKVPLLVDGDLRLYESQIINEYLADAHGWQPAFARDPALCARQRLAMKQWDASVLPTFYASLKDATALGDERRDAVGKELDEMQRTIELMGASAEAEDGTPPVESLLGFHCATFWARMLWLREYTGIVDLASRRPRLRRWLDRTVEIPAVQQTLPEREWTVQRYEERYVSQRSAA